MFGRDAPGFDELEIDWGPASPFGPNDDPGTPMTHQDSSESDELRPDLFEPGAAPLPAPEPVVTPAANAQPERPVAPFIRTLYALLEGPYDETLCEWSENGRRIVFPDPTQSGSASQRARSRRWRSGRSDTVGDQRRRRDVLYAQVRRDRLPAVLPALQVDVIFADAQHV